MTSTLQGKVKKFEITDLLRGYNDFDKVGNFYRDLRTSLGQPVFTSPRNLVIINNSHRSYGYTFQLFRGDIDLVSIELFSHWTGYSHEYSMQPSLDQPTTHFFGLDVTLSEEEGRIIGEIMNLNKKYPFQQKENFE
jgi:hypothetical protein